MTLAIPAGAPAPRTRATRFGRLSLDPGDPLAALEALRFLRDATAERRPVEWRLGEGWTEELMAALVHLVPPVDGPQRWRERHRFGMLYWRAGPGFATVKDTRGEPAGWGRYLLDDAASLEAFRDLRRPRPITEAARPLIDAGLVLDLGGLGLALPYRIRRWPIPSDSI